LYGEPFGSPLIGDEKTMGSIDRKKMLAKFKQIYQPNNLILCVVGDADFNEVVKFAEKNFGEGGGSVPEFKIKLKNGSKIVKRKGIDQANLIFAYHLPLGKDKRNYAAQVLNTLMAGGMSSKLFSEIREKRNLAYAVKGHAVISNDFAYNVVYVGTTKENVEIVKKIILEELAKVAKGLTEKELKQIKEQMIGNYHISMEDSQSQMASLLYAEIDGDAQKFYDFEKNISEVKLKDVRDLAKIDKYSFLALVPE
jgi:predicted Zn-dependent peptidase